MLDLAAVRQLSHQLILASFKDIAESVFRVCRVQRPELVDAQDTSVLKFAVGDTKGVLSSYVCEEVMLLSYSCSSPESKTALIDSLLYAILLTPPTDFQKCARLIKILEDVIGDVASDNGSTAQLRSAAIDHVIKVVVLLLHINSVPIENLMQWIVPLVIRQQDARDAEFATENEEDLFSESSSPFVVLVMTMLRMVVPGSASTTSQMVMETLVSIHLQTRPDTPEGIPPMQLFLAKCPRLALTFVTHLCRWIMASFPQIDRYLRLLKSLLNMQEICAYIGGGGSEIRRALCETAKLCSWDVLLPSIAEGAIDPVLLAKLTLPSGAQRWLDFLLLSTNAPSAPDKLDVRALPFLDGAVNPGGLPENSVALRMMAAYTPKHLDLLLAGRLSPKVDALCPAMLVYVGSLVGFHIQNGSIGQQIELKHTFMAKLSSLKLLAYIPLSQTPVESRFVTIIYWLLSICGAGYRFPLTQVCGQKLVLAEEERVKLPSSYVFGIQVSAWSVAVARWAFLSPLVDIYLADTQVRQVAQNMKSYWENQKISSLGPKIKAITQCLPPSMLNCCMAAAMLLACSCRETPLEAEGSSSIQKWKRRILHLHGPLRIIQTSLSDPSQITRFLDAYWVAKFIFDQMNADAFFATTVTVSLLMGSFFQVCMEAVSGCFEETGVRDTPHLFQTLKSYLETNVHLIRTSLIGTFKEHCGTSDNSFSTLVSLLHEALKDLMREPRSIVDRDLDEARSEQAPATSIALRTFAGAEVSASAEVELQRFLKAGDTVQEEPPSSETESPPQPPANVSPVPLEISPEAPSITIERWSPLTPIRGLPSARAIQEQIVIVLERMRHHYFATSRATDFVGCPWIENPELQALVRVLEAVGDADLCRVHESIDITLETMGELPIFDVEEKMRHRWIEPSTFWFHLLIATEGIRGANLQAMRLCLMQSEAHIANVLCKLTEEIFTHNRKRHLAGLVIRLIFLSMTFSMNPWELLTAAVSQFPNHGPCLDICCFVDPADDLHSQLTKSLELFGSDSEWDLLFWLLAGALQISKPHRCRIALEQDIRLEEWFVANSGFDSEGLVSPLHTLVSQLKKLAVPPGANNSETNNSSQYIHNLDKVAAALFTV
eukprot:Gregarina_sp_Poly_1__2239@NODE_159_length_12283_cov_147_306729_g141_i0_p1_GENE_NODE_159_length_12283_cov_147_306729_g141_i0NODE_159_length_12283_cov_147_306729_g141_i0_p1_ORF_typecomplete_len1116_score169_14_NODE_159_length_12283_cov_147_306729_g141_i061809527